MRLLLTLLLAVAAHSASADAPSVSLHTEPRLGGAFVERFTGESKCLDIVNDGSGRVQLAQCGDYSGQYWSMLSSRRD